VRGDAIAGLLVVLINVIGGMVIGIVQQGLTFAEAAHTYTFLTVGDGLVTQVPALIVSTAARRRACWRSRKSIRAPGSRPWPASEAFPRSGGRAARPDGRNSFSRTMACGLFQRAVRSRGGTKTPLTRYHGCSRFSEAAFSGQQLALSWWRQQFSFGCGSRPFSLARNDRRDAMNHSMYSADGRTHLKIVVIGLLCATLVAAVGIFAQVRDVDLGTAPLVKAGQPTAMTGRLPSIR